MASFVIENELIKTKHPNKIDPKQDKDFLFIIKTLCGRRVLPLYRDEIRLGIILIKNGITDFEYSKKFPTTKIHPDKENWEPETPDKAPETNTVTENHREVDFFLQSPIKVVFCTNAVQAFEVKSGNLTIDSWVQRRELRDCESKITTFMVLGQHLDFWEKNGFTSLNVNIQDVFCQKFPLPTEFLNNEVPGDSECAWKIANILKECGINFNYPKNKRWKNIFWLEKPIQVFWSSEPIKVIMIVPKGEELTIGVWLRRRHLMSNGLDTFIALPQHMYFWGEWGLIRQKKRKGCK